MTSWYWDGPRVSFRERFFHRDSNTMGIGFKYNFIVWYHIAKNWITIDKSFVKWAPVGHIHASPSTLAYPRSLPSEKKMLTHWKCVILLLVSLHHQMLCGHGNAGCCMYHRWWKFRLNIRRSQRSMRLVRIDVLLEVRNEECDEINLRQE